MNVTLSQLKFDKLQEKTFEVILITEMLCEVCKKPLYEKKRFVRKIKFSNLKDYHDLLNRARIHDRNEVDLEKGTIFFFDHDFPGDVHHECIEKL